jgi:hypothetical protein
MIGNVAAENRVVEKHFELLNKEAVSVQKRANRVAQTSRAEETSSHAAQD